MIREGGNKLLRLNAQHSPLTGSVFKQKVYNSEIRAFLDSLEENGFVALVDQGAHVVPFHFFRDPEQKIAFVEELQVIPE
jgi:hypothetical protein